jgi:hypothetical protein
MTLAHMTIHFSGPVAIDRSVEGNDADDARKAAEREARGILASGYVDRQPDGVVFYPASSVTKIIIRGLYIAETKPEPPAFYDRVADIERDIEAITRHADDMTASIPEPEPASKWSLLKYLKRTRTVCR